MTSGKCTTAFNKVFPQKRPRANRSETAIPIGRLHSIAQSATLSDRRIAATSSGENAVSALTGSRSVAVLRQHREALLLEQRPCRRAVEIGGEGLGVGVGR